jgi:hypothetical protein
MSGQFDVFKVLLAKYYFDGFVHGRRELVLGKRSTRDQADEQHHNDHDIGVAIIDAYTHFILAYLETIIKTSKATLQDFVSPPLAVAMNTND